ncbi:uncharacterized protein EI97DRAFT_460260 [Westerdykella ornata]|uniref:Uncharacterized protein n=1 Tax=Westerdykella ornata TaxID=318751 RepID=A0A6A6JFK0_WESOR|nr:uncharacterized protein EI97DRAFT_460260 [Westerdykella ornata]KAF2274406.1 hypothetical protein EI97DRAFT_460260 [Westerdykella ornata]
MDQEAQHSLLKRSTSLWRRFSTRRAKERVERAENQQKVDHSTVSPGRNRLQKRTIELPRRAPGDGTQDHNDGSEPRKDYRQSDGDIKSTMTMGHMQRIHVPIPTSHLLTPPPTPSPPSTASRPSAISTPSRTSTRVLATDVPTAPFPRSPGVQTTPWNVFLTPAQVYALVQGFRPETMEDKWFVYSEGPDHSGKLKVHFHRSWTGMKIAELFVVIDLRGEGAGKIVGIKWDAGEKTNGMDVGEVKYTIAMACRWALGVNLEGEMEG